ncbi:MAG: transposase, partial [Gomphosphaeria aponina SAG 52.96 = DSM 107014]|nr:transposase [Gomphosphaeria aponina SAG 52.96 = DSM 107014]
ASFHQSSKIKELIEKARCKLIFLPPYSPDLNKIEKFWARLKHYLRTTLSEFESLELALNNALKYVS